MPFILVGLMVLLALVTPTAKKPVKTKPVNELQKFAMGEFAVNINRVDLHSLLENKRDV